jgi:hypothetical protein
MKVCVPLEKGDEIPWEDWYNHKVPWGFKEIDEKDFRPPNNINNP